MRAMSVNPPANQSNKRRRLVAIIVTGIVALIAIYPFASCARTGAPSNADPTSALSPIATSEISPTATTPRASLAASTAVASSQGQTSPWKLAWNDEFNGPRGAPPDPNKWTPSIGGEGWGNQQLEYDTDNKNAYLDGQGNLILEARNNDAAKYQCWYGPCQYTSAHISTGGHFTFTYGLLEASIKIPRGQGIWSAFWLLGNNCTLVGWPACGEIDAMENISQQPDLVYGTAHGPGDFSGTYKLPHGNFSDNYHLFALEWDPDHLYFYVDGINYYTVNRATLARPTDWVYNHPFSIILNLPVGGVWPGSPNSSTIFPQRMYISYVRLYKTGS